MKKLIAGIALFGTFAIASAQTITFDKTTFDYGTIKPSADGTRFFTVTNTGDKPLVISNVKPSCGCTTPEFSTDPVMPGKSAKIKVGYNTTINGPFNKMIEVFSNDPANSRSVIYIKGNVDANAPEVAATPAKVETAADAKAAKKAAKAAKKVAAAK
ncbi:MULTISPECIES: DUF1573 domain-containing protein [Chryseobacterium]|uniref:DUF1573 domain-containing protein n=1 Tax=Chryseobacterium TaxID=59732 RepID=UPI001551A83D|nr:MULTISPECIES: DUF1573 domain-containing protein [unclassified Chryseobacterium]MDC8105157.1 DUF1573 domain-containing protein [Chryseobacterium sp. B21-037]MDQ1805415.1 DUF1573 domain-containing protein [Chryseobacterium sp. CKR4-1]WBV58570.1 DUF1573 domain-containing protein [Chryseobacterium daecheongense]